MSDGNTVRSSPSHLNYLHLEPFRQTSGGQEFHAPWYRQIPRPKIYIYINHPSTVITCKSASSSSLQLQIGGSLVPNNGNYMECRFSQAPRDNGVDSWCMGSGPESSPSTPCWFYGADMALRQS